MIGSGPLHVVTQNDQDAAGQPIQNGGDDIAEQLMRILFLWQKAPGGFTPSCRVLAESGNGTGPLACLLMDDGGQGYLDTLSWIDAGLAKSDAVAGGGELETSWDREDWGAKLKTKEAVIYSLHDQDATQTMSLAAFRRTLLAWRDFLQSTPDTRTECVVEV